MPDIYTNEAGLKAATGIHAQEAADFAAEKGLKRTWVLKLGVGIKSGQLTLAITGFMLLTFMTIHLVQFRFGELSCAVGVAKPHSFFMEAYGTEQGAHSPDFIPT